jgi:hypothetical protein
MHCQDLREERHAEIVMLGNEPVGVARFGEAGLCPPKRNILEE